MFYFKCVRDDYIISVGKSEKRIFEEITEEEYGEIIDAVSGKPSSQSETHRYMLKTDLTWELCQIPVAEQSEAEQKATAYDILTGVRE